MSELLKNLSWRYATKKMNGVAVSEEKVNTIIEAARLAPTSSGLQPFEIILITNPEVKQQLLPLAFNQQQIVDASHILVFAAWNGDFTNRIGEVFALTNAERGLPADASSDYKDFLTKTFEDRSLEENFNFSARQAYIAFGMAIAAAAEQKVDATPMEGFDGPAVDALLKLDQRALKTVTILPLGYRDQENDWLVNLKKVRKPLDKLVQVIE